MEGEDKRDGGVRLSCGIVSKGKKKTAVISERRNGCIKCVAAGAAGPASTTLSQFSQRARTARTHCNRIQRILECDDTIMNVSW